MKYDLRRGRALALLVGARERECWANAVKVVLKFEGYRYVEGWAVPDHGVPVEHGWVVNDHGTILEVTPNWFTMVDTAYFPVQDLTRDQMLDMFATLGVVEPPFYRRDRKYGWTLKPMYEAFTQAVQHMFNREETSP